jgi:hypothetical protein
LSVIFFGCLYKMTTFVYCLVALSRSSRFILFMSRFSLQFILAWIKMAPLFWKLLLLHDYLCLLSCNIVTVIILILSHISLLPESRWPKLFWNFGFFQSYLVFFFNIVLLRLIENNCNKQRPLQFSWILTNLFFYNCKKVCGRIMVWVCHHCQKG